MNYDKFDKEDLINNTNCFTKLWVPNWPFSNITQCLQNLKEIANDDNVPIHDQEISNAIDTVVLNTVLFYGKYYKWDNNTSNQKTLTTFQANFIKAHQK